MKEQAYNIIKTKDSRTQRQSNLKNFKEARFKISPQEFEDHILGEIASLKYVCEHGSSESAGSLTLRKIDYFPKRRWNNLDRKTSRIMIKVIDQQLFERRLMRNSEKFVGGKEYGNDFRLLERTI
ncbi:hypothetical protein Tco_0268992 [Tanacetum coccineum]